MKSLKGKYRVRLYDANSEKLAQVSTYYFEVTIEILYDAPPADDLITTRFYDQCNG